MQRPRVTVCILSLVAGFALSASAAESNLSKSSFVRTSGQLVVDADRGSVQITTADQPRVTVEVLRKIQRVKESRAKELFAAHEVTFEQDGDRVEVHAAVKKESRKLFDRGDFNLQVQYRISVPKRFNLDVKTAAGDVTATDIEGKVKARTAGGSLRFAAIEGTFEGATAAGGIELDSVTGTVEAKTSGGNIQAGELGGESVLDTSAGSIRVKACKGRLSATTRGGSIEAGRLDARAKLETAAGSIHVKSAGAPVEARTSGGDIKLTDAQDAVTARTAAGSITVGFSAQPKDDCSLTTSGGGITVSIADKIAFDLDARTSGGSVKTELPVAAEVLGAQRADHLKGRLNGGGKALVLQTSAGDINLRKLESGSR